MDRMKCGLIGRKLGHSWSPRIHRELGDYDYGLYEMEEGEIEPFLRNGTWRGMNVTIPYKKTVVPYLDELSPAAEALGSVNTIVRGKDGRLYGDNTDVFGFEAMARRFGFDLRGKKILVLGSGGASAAVREALERLGAGPVIIISRSGENHYGNISRHADAEYIVNTTPVGMYPETDAMPLDPAEIPGCRGVMDIIYNPPDTKLTRRARELGIRACTGLYMLVGQAWKSAEMFLGQEIPESRIESVYRGIAAEMREKGMEAAERENGGHADTEGSSL